MLVSAESRHAVDPLRMVFEVYANPVAMLEGTAVGRESNGVVVFYLSSVWYVHQRVLQVGGLTAAAVRVHPFLGAVLIIAILVVISLSLV